jgi:hypothetical protein
MQAEITTADPIHTDMPAPMLTPIPRLLLRPAEAALALGISARLLWSKTKAGEIPCIKIGKAVRYSPEALAKFVQQMENGD